MKTSFILFTSCLFSILACQKSNESTVNEDFLEVQFIEEVCCGNLILQGNQMIKNFARTRQDSLLYGVDMDSYTEVEIGDIFQIKLEVLPFPVPDEYGYSCLVDCNRWHGIPIKITELIP